MSTILTILFLILLNGFFSLSEMAIVASKKSILKEMVKKGYKSAYKVLEIIENQGKFLSTIQVGITTVGIFAAAYGGATIAHKFAFLLNKIPLIAKYSETIALTIVVATLTYVSVVVGELVPKRIALKNPEKIAVFIVNPMLMFSKIFSPIIDLLDNSAEIIMKLFGFFDNAEIGNAEAELKAIINEGVESGEIEKSEHEMMHRIFLLDDRDAKSIMTHLNDIVFFKIDDGVEEVKEKLTNNSQHSRYPVLNNQDKIIGIVQTKELLNEYINSKKINIKNHLKEVKLIDENINCLKILEMFKASSITLAVVVDENGKTQGIVTAADIFEAIVGMIPANYDKDDKVMIVKHDENSWFVDGIAPIEEIIATLDIQDMNEDIKYDTIAGFFLENYHEEIIEGAKFEKYNSVFEIVDMDGEKIDKIMIEKIQNEAQRGQN